MTAIAWSNGLSVGIQEIDLQHRRLIELFGELDRAVAQGADKEFMAKALKELNAYVREHFTLEERWMSRHGYPRLAEHAAQHESFIEKLLHFELDFLRGESGVSREILDYLEDWLKEHVSVQDQDYARYFQEKGVL